MMLIKSRARFYLMRALAIVTIQVGFIVAKVTGLLGWPWLWVFVPVFIVGAVLVIALSLAAIFYFISGN